MEKIDGSRSAGGRGVDEGQAVEKGGDTIEGKAANHGFGVVGASFGKLDIGEVFEGVGKGAVVGEPHDFEGGIENR